MRLLPGMAADEVLSEVRAQLAGALGAGTWSFDLQPTGNYAAFSGPADLGFRSTVEALCGCSAKTALFATEAPYLSQLGLETLVLGAGDIRVAHQPDEYVTMAGIERATDLYADLIRRYCTETA